MVTPVAAAHKKRSKSQLLPAVVGILTYRPSILQYLLTQQRGNQPLNTGTETMVTKQDRSKQDPIITVDVVCAWLIAAALVGSLAVMGYGDASFAG